ncbi:MAG: hypothetical protein A3C90_02710 [Candidatus Magasanikbacteria bacterium RIFCSPHIGHO2_02_FULL_51_14]|uniref:Lipoprotein n=1 Tax=Candidatus Magasanikbacteria bacterium RIFCSPHIGHO2_02_FULL_51_14 TaxID=1798683 RepID=A0A1F6MPB2_9BACT|nr:MAG: hypothetical protein A3C90_02710 [Candidatus Magasanikbacteria bacterium RIFCSPHIGHO2_02_FULL_51_14]
MKLIVHCAGHVLLVGLVAIGCSGFVLAFTSNPVLAHFAGLGVVASAATTVVERSEARHFQNWPRRGP